MAAEAFYFADTGVGIKRGRCETLGAGLFNLLIHA
jgi:hypothetical protein